MALVSIQIRVWFWSLDARQISESSSGFFFDVMNETGWQHFSHGADLGVSGWGATVETAFEQTALALTAAVTTADVTSATPVKISCEAANLDLLLVAWLNAVIYEMAVRNMVFGRFEVEIRGDKLEATIWGETVDRKRHEPACEPKGATFTELKVSQADRGRWSTRCVVDV